MTKRPFIFTLFILMALAQLYVPAKMILEREDIVKNGTKYKFRTAPVDPTDPFRGKYVALRFAQDTVVTLDEYTWERGETIYVHFKTDENGFSSVRSASKEKPVDHTNFFKTKVKYTMGNDRGMLTIEYPFDRFYMEESKAYDAERIYRKSSRDSSQIAYALVSIKDGESVLQDVLIDGVSLRELVRREQEGKK